MNIKNLNNQIAVSILEEEVLKEAKKISIDDLTRKINLAFKLLDDIKEPPKNILTFKEKAKSKLEFFQNKINELKKDQLKKSLEVPTPTSKKQKKQEQEIKENEIKEIVDTLNVLTCFGLALNEIPETLITIIPNWKEKGKEALNDPEKKVKSFEDLFPDDVDLFTGVVIEKFKLRKLISSESSPDIGKVADEIEYKPAFFANDFILMPLEKLNKFLGKHEIKLTPLQSEKSEDEENKPKISDEKDPKKLFKIKQNIEGFDNKLAKTLNNRELTGITLQTFKNLVEKNYLSKEGLFAILNDIE